MHENYGQIISRLIKKASSFEIDTEIRMEGRPPSSASSEFLTNKEQGDWAERVVLSAINENCSDYFAISYGRGDGLSAGDIGFSDFYRGYQDELNSIGKKPDILIFKRTDFSDQIHLDLANHKTVSRAVAAIEVRSSSFLAKNMLYLCVSESMTQNRSA